MPLYVLLITAFVFLLVSAASYFFVKKKVFLFSVLLFYSCSVLLSHLLLLNHPVIFYIIIALLVAFPIICLIIFVFDVYRALFCIDTSFVFVVVWLLMPALFVVNFVIYVVNIIYA